MSDILKYIEIRVSCKNCEADLTVTADVIAESQELMAGGCPGDRCECPAPFVF